MNINIKRGRRGAPLVLLLLSALLMPVFVVNTSAETASESGAVSVFSDVALGDWYYAEVCELAALGIVNGYPDGSFRPEVKVSYAEALKMILSAAGYSVQPAASGEWYQPYLDFAYAKGIADEEGAPPPDAPISRDRSAELIVRAMGLPLTVREKPPFIDSENVYAAALYDADIALGERSGELLYFRGGRQLNRAELSALVWRMHVYLETTPNPVVETPLLPSGCRLPEAPVTVEDFVNMLIYLSVNGIEEHTFIYRGVDVKTVKEEYIPRLSEAYPIATDLCRESVIYYHYYNINLAYARNYVAMTVKLRGRDYTAAECREMFDYTLAAAEEALETIRAALAAEGIAEPSQREMAQGCLSWLAAHCRYLDGERQLDQYAYSVFYDGHSVCSGYTAAYNLLLKLCGIRCMSMTGMADNGSTKALHAWTIAELDGEICFIDATWSDPVCEPDDPSNISYAYFALDEAAFSEKHTPDWDFRAYWGIME